MAKTSPLFRQWALLRLLVQRRFGLTVAELADEMNVSQKTIRRDLELLRDVGLPIVETVGSHGRKSWRAEAQAILAQLVSPAAGEWTSSEASV